MESEKPENPRMPTIPNYIEFHHAWPTDEKYKILNDMIVIDDFLTATEEEDIFKEIDPYLQRLHYEFDHWDDVSNIIYSIIFNSQLY